MDDDSLFPAYRDYIQGTSTRQSTDNDGFVAIPDEASSNASIISDGLVFGSASSRHPSSPAILDLRSPSIYPVLIKLIPPEAVQPAPPAPNDEDFTLTERSSQSLLGASRHSASSTTLAPTSSQQLLHNLKQAARPNKTPRRRDRPPCQATRPLLRRSASNTDVDSEIGQTPARMFPIPSIESPIESPVVSKPRLTRLNSLDPARSSFGALIRPGDLLNQARFAILPAQWRQQANASLNQLWNFASAHSDPKTNNEGLSRLAEVSANIYKMLQNQENAVRAHHGKQTLEPQQQSLEAHQPHLAHKGAEATKELRSRIDKAFAHLLVAIRTYKVSPQDPTALQVVKTYPTFRKSLGLEGVRYLDTLIADAKAHEDLPFDLPVPQNPSAHQPSTRQLQVKTSPQHLDYQQQQQQQARQTGYYTHPPVPQQQQIPQDQRRHSALLQAQREVPVAVVSDAVRFFVNDHVPEYFDAVGYLKQPPKTCVPALRQKAHAFLDQFDKALPHEGHNYLMEIVRRVAADKSFGLYD